jgi:hypothetical protein
MNLPQGYKNLCLKYDNIVHHATMQRDMRLGKDDMLVKLPQEGTQAVKVALVFDCEVIAVFEEHNFVTLYVPHKLVSRNSYWQRIKQIVHDNECRFDIHENGVVTVTGLYDNETFTMRDGIRMTSCGQMNDGIVYSPLLITQ